MERVNVSAAIRVAFPRKARRGARCIVRREVGRGRASFRADVYGSLVGAEGEVGPFQAHPGWWRDGWAGRPPAFPGWGVALRRDALVAAWWARWLWESSGRSWAVSWPHTAALCGLDRPPRRVRDRAVRVAHRQATDAWLTSSHHPDGAGDAGS